MFSRRNLALLATAALITGLIVGPAIAGGGDGSPEPAPVEPSPASTKPDPSEPERSELETPESEDSQHDVNQICVGGDIASVRRRDYPELELEPFEGFDLSPEDRERLERLDSELRAALEKIEGLAPAAFEMIEPDLDQIEKALTDAGLSVERTTTADGATCLSVDGDHEAFEAAIDEVFGELDGLDLDVFPHDLPARAAR